MTEREIPKFFSRESGGRSHRFILKFSSDHNLSKLIHVTVHLTLSFLFGFISDVSSILLTNSLSEI